MPEYRAKFDATAEFTNGGELTATGFRIDLPDANADEAVVGRLFVQSLGLALVARTLITNLQIVEEKHRGTRGLESSAPVTPSAKRYVELSHVIRAGLDTYPGLPVPTITPHLTREDSASHYAPGTEFAMDILTMIGNTGTYLDSPFHRYEGGTDLAGLSLESLVDLPTEVFHVHDSLERGVPASVFFDRDVRGKAVLIHTGWDRLFGAPEYARDAPFLTGEGVDYLLQNGVTLVGIDSLNIDDTSAEAAGERPAHTRLLAAGVHVVEHLTNLGELPASGATFTATPPLVERFGTFPVRAFATIG